MQLAAGRDARSVGPPGRARGVCACGAPVCACPRALLAPPARPPPARRAVRELAEAHRERLRNVLADEGSETEQRIDILTRDITARFSGAGAKLKRVAAGRADAPHTADEGVRLNIQRSLAARLHQMSGEFRTSQKRYLTEVRKTKASTSLSALVGTGPEAGGGAGDDVDEGFTEGQESELREMEHVAQERDEEIAHIAKSITELAEIFKEINVLIVDQGTLLDRIDHNVDLALDRVREGVEHLHKAEKYQKSARPFKCIAVLMVLIIIMVIILIVRKSG